MEDRQIWINPNITSMETSEFKIETINVEVGEVLKIYDEYLKCFTEAFDDELIYGESIIRTDSNGNPRCIRVGSDEYNEIMSRIDYGR